MNRFWKFFATHSEFRWLPTRDGIPTLPLSSESQEQIERLMDDKTGDGTSFETGKPKHKTTGLSFISFSLLAVALFLTLLLGGLAIAGAKQVPESSA
jgi:hypothetical protein